MVELKRELGVVQAMLLGLGAIIGTGVFVSIGIAASVTGPSVVLAVAVACVVAVCNGLSSAQLAASHPVSGGTYEYGYRWLNPLAGFTAGWMFLCAKSASAATAALGFSAYLLTFLGHGSSSLYVPVAATAVVLLTLLVLQGISRTSLVNSVIVAVTLSSLVLLILCGTPQTLEFEADHWRPFMNPADQLNPLAAFGQACALMFVAFTGYGRIATMGEEVRDPERTIPRAMILTLIVSSLLYMLVAVVAVGVVGVDGIAQQTLTGTAALFVVADAAGGSPVVFLLTCGAVSAMLGVLLNLLLGLSRVMLAMGRRQDLPRQLGKVSAAGGTPVAAVIAVAVIILVLVCTGDVGLTWSFSALTVLIYYSLTNLAALQLRAEQQLYPRFVSWLGLVLCLLLALHLDGRVWAAGGCCLAAGLVIRRVCNGAAVRKMAEQKTVEQDMAEQDPVESSGES